MERKEEREDRERESSYQLPFFADQTKRKRRENNFGRIYDVTRTITFAQ